MDDRPGLRGKFIEEGDGNMPDRNGCGACMGDWEGIDADPEEEETVGCGELAIGGRSEPYGLLRL